MEEKKRGNRIGGGELPGVVFLGTPEFALPSLRRLVEAGADVRLVVTQPDRPRGRGKKLAPPPVKVLAEELGLPVFQPQRVRDRDALETICSQAAECLVVAAFGQLLPKPLLECYPLGAVNVHPSLLPRHRGAAPIQRSILEGERVTGVSIMLLNTGMDTGPVLSRREVVVREEDTFGTLHEKLSRLGADLLCETLSEWRSGRISPEPQNDALATLAPPIQKEELRIDWHRSARRIVDKIRALDPVPGAFAFYGEKRVKLFSASILPWKGEGGPGEIVGRTESGLVILGEDGQALMAAELQLEGQRRISAPEFLRGHPMPPGTHLA